MFPHCSPVVNGRNDGLKKGGKSVKLAINFNNQAHLLNGQNNIYDTWILKCIMDSRVC